MRSPRVLATANLFSAFSHIMHRHPLANILSGSTHLLKSIVLLAVLLVIGSTSVVTAQGEPVGAAYRGERIFLEHCTQCHGPEGRGDGPMSAEVPVPIADFTDPTFVDTRSPQYLHEVITEGRMQNLMPPWGEALSDDEIWDAAAYIWSLHLTAADLAGGTAAYEQGCVECHASDGAGVEQTPPVPDLSDTQWLALNQTELLAAVTSDPHPAVETLSDSEIELATEIARDFSLGFGLAATNVNGEGTVDVVVINETTGDMIGGLPVRLYTFEGDSFVSTQTVETNADGLARFEALPTGTSWVYVTEVLYNDTPFGSDMQQFADQSTALEIALPVYEGGGSVSDISVDRAHWVVNLNDPQIVDVGEIYILTNAGNQVFDGEESADGIRRVIFLTVPENAINVGVEGADLGDRFLVEDNAVIDTMPMAPGQRQILIRYSLLVEDEQVELSHSIDYPISHLNLLAPDVGLEIEAPDWDEGEAMGAQDGSYRNFTRSNVEAGEESVAVLSNINTDTMPQAPVERAPEGREIVDREAKPGISGQPYFPYLLIGFALVVLIVGTILVVRRQHKTDQDSPQVQESQRESLIQQLAELDDDFEAGELSQSDYESERRILKAQLISLMREEDRA